jgi:hypothetical protein
MTRHHVVVLTGGALPGQDTPAPRSHDLNAVRTEMHQALTVLGELTGNIETRAYLGERLTSLVTAAWKAGHAVAARDHRVAAAFVLGDDRETADRFAKFITGEVDPAYVIHALDPADELLRHWENCAGRTVG